MNPRTYRDWKREIYSLPQKVVRKLSANFNIELPEDENELIKRWKLRKIESGKTGGFARLKLYGTSGTPEGRSRGGSNAMQIMRKNGIIPEAKKFKFPQKYDNALAEWFGIMLGDGGMTPSQIRITLNRIADKEYIPYVLKLGEKLFGERPKFIERSSHGVVVVYLTGINLIKYFLSNGMKLGNKVKIQIDVPNWIKENIEFSWACLRGLVDTDGGIFVHKYKVNGKIYSYRKLNFANRSIPLINFVFSTLDKFNLNPKLAVGLETKHVWLYNEKSTKKYIEVIGTNNPRLVKYFGGYPDRLRGRFAKP